MSMELHQKRQKLIAALQKNPSEDKLWECFVAYQHFLFYTASGLPFRYTINIGRNGSYTKEIIVDRREESKTLAWSSVMLAFRNAMDYEGVVARPKALGDIRGISYTYSIFYKFGLIDVPEKIKCKMEQAAECVEKMKSAEDCGHEGGEVR